VWCGLVVTFVWCNVLGVQAGHKEEENHFEEELEINDYPQQARWKVTHRDTMREVSDMTACAIICRGRHYPTGKEPASGEERKL
jgi:hypothetical protein